MRPGSTGSIVFVTTVPETLPFLRKQVERLQASGFEVHCVSSSGPLLDRFHELSGVPVHEVSMPRTLAPLADLQALAKLVALFVELHPDAVHSSTPKAGLLGTTAAAIARVPTRVYQMRGLPMDTASGPLKVVFWGAELVSCTLAHRVIAVGKSVREAAIARRLCRSDKVRVLAGGSGQGVDAARFAPDRYSREQRAKARARFGIPEGATVVGFVGRIVSEKGVPELAMAWSRLRERHPNAHLVLVGPRETRDPVPALILDALDSDSRAHFTGHVLEPAELIAIMDVVALPTHREGFPNVPLEAAAMEVPVVASDLPACREAVEHGRTGLLFPVRDDQALERALETYLANPALRREHGKRARARVLDEFSADRSAEALLAEYLELVPRSPSAAG
ncbi:MAG: glycosyltransferase family 4 protein [Deltaproteobacteria bacterium]|nr:glycosyltransferase family 4 protein [Deltaproteobacteria bacterium]